MRSFVRQVHLWMGLTFGALFVLLGLTGSVLVFYPEIDALLHPEIRAEGRHTPDWDRALATVRSAYPDKAGAWRFEVTDGQGTIPARYYNPPETAGRGFAPMMVWLSPDGGQVLRRDYWGDYAMTFLYDLHYRLLLGAVGGTSLGIAGLVAIVLLFWIGRERRIRAEALRDQGEALQEALAHAEAQSRRAQAAAQLNQRLLSLAGEDLQAPLSEIRGSAERLLAVHAANPELSRPMAAIARHASELMQIVLRMRESAEAGERADQSGLLSDVLEHAVIDADARARQRQQRLRAQLAPATTVTADRDTLTQLCAELLDHALRRNPADSNIDVVLRQEAGQAVMTLSDHDGALRELLLDAQHGHTRDHTSRRLGLGLLRETVARLGGTLDSIPATAPETGQLLRMMLPLVE
jgi:signal transduction histidine kinase